MRQPYKCALTDCSLPAAPPRIWAACTVSPLGLSQPPYGSLGPGPVRWLALATVWLPPAGDCSAAGSAGDDPVFGSCCGSNVVWGTHEAALVVAVDNLRSCCQQGCRQRAFTAIWIVAACRHDVRGCQPRCLRQNRVT